MEGNLAAVILAAGMGTRMKSRRPKVMHCLLGAPLISHVIGVVEGAGIASGHQIVVAGHGRQMVEKYLAGMGVRVAYQAEQLGTGHAVLCAEKAFRGFNGQMLIICGDTPLFKPETLKAFINAHENSEGDLSILSAEFDEPAGYGRIVRDSQGRLTAVVEEKDAGPSIKKIREVNTGTYLVRASVIFHLLEQVGCNNAQGEYYLTDTVELGLKAGLNVNAFKFAGPEEALGVNSRYQLSVAEGIMLSRIRTAHMEAGVTINMPETVYIEPSVRIGADALISPPCVLKGRTEIGGGSVIGPFSYLEDFICGPGTVIEPYSRKSAGRVSAGYCT